MESQAVFQAETQAKFFLLNWAPGPLPVRPRADRRRERRRGLREGDRRHRRDGGDPRRRHGNLPAAEGPAISVARLAFH